MCVLKVGPKIAQVCVFEKIIELSQEKKSTCYKNLLCMISSEKEVCAQLNAEFSREMLQILPYLMNNHVIFLFLFFEHF